MKRSHQSNRRMSNGRAEALLRVSCVLRFLTVVWLNIVLAACVWPMYARGEEGCRVVQQERRVELCSPFFTFRLDTAAGLRAESWENRLTGRKLSLGNGPELEFDIGLPDAPLANAATGSRGSRGERSGRGR